MPSTAPFNLINEAPQARVEQFLRNWTSTRSPAEVLPSERDLADQLGVGRTTVRRAILALSRHGLVQREGRRLRVSKLGPTSGNGLLTRTVVMFIPRACETDSQGMQWNEYLSFGSARAVRLAGLNALSVTSDNPTDDEIRQIVQQKPMGVLIPETFTDPQATLRAARLVAKAHIPVVIYGGAVEQTVFDRVMSDHEAGSEMLTIHFIAQGFKRIVQFWPRPWDRYWFKARQLGYERAMQQGGLTPLPTMPAAALQRCNGNRELFDTQVRLAAGHLVPLLTSDAPPHVLLCGSDRDVAYVIAACRLFSREVGRDIQVAGYDGYLSMCEERQFEPTLPAATVSKQNQQMGEAMVALLLDRIAGKLPEAPQTRVVQPKLEVFDHN